MKGRFFLAFVLAALVGSALHFGYDLCPSPLVGLICPVSESVWEHTNLMAQHKIDAGSGTFGGRKRVLTYLGFESLHNTVNIIFCHNLQKQRSFYKFLDKSSKLHYIKIIKDLRQPPA